MNLSANENDIQNLEEMPSRTVHECHSAFCYPKNAQIELVACCQDPPRLPEISFWAVFGWQNAEGHSCKVLECISTKFWMSFSLALKFTSCVHLSCILITHEVHQHYDAHDKKHFSSTQFRCKDQYALKRFWTCMKFQMNVIDIKPEHDRMQLCPR